MFPTISLKGKKAKAKQRSKMITLPKRKFKMNNAQPLHLGSTVTLANLWVPICNVGFLPELEEGMNATTQRKPLTECLTGSKLARH